MEEEGKFVREGSLFPFKIPSNFHSCTINLSTCSKGQIEDKYYSLYFMTRNLTRNYVNEFRDDTPRDKIFLTCVKNLWNRETDMLFGGLQLVEESGNIELTFPHLLVEYSWFVPCPKLFSRLQRNFYIFSSYVWISVVVVLFLVTVVSWCLAKQSNDIRSYANMSSALYNIWAVTVGASVTETPRSLRLKLFFVVFV
jgi:Ca2+/Na+ antiporter